MSLIAHTIAGGTDPTTIQTSGINTTGGNLAVAITSYLVNPGRPTISDDFGSTWHDLTPHDNPTVHTGLRMSWAMLAGTGASHKFQSAGLNCYPALAVLVFNLAIDPPFDQENGFAAEGAGPYSTVQPGSITPTQDNEIVVFGVAWDVVVGAGQGSVSSPYTLVDQTDYTGFILGTGSAYVIQATAAATNPTWTFGGQQNDINAVIASFKAQAQPGFLLVKN